MNIWWANEPDEHYWLEITDRVDLGADLYAPKVHDAGRPYWSYNLVTLVDADDVVLHWHKTLGESPGIVGWSIATGELEESTIVWQARGTSGRRHGPTGAEPAWRMPLTGYAPLLDPVDQEAVRREESALRAVHQTLTETHRGPLYFPFAFSDRRAVRTAQAYLVKFPAALLDAFPELHALPRPGARSARGASPTSTPARKHRPGQASYYQSDPVVKTAIERHAVERATAYFTDLGYDVQNVGAFESFDLLVSLGDETRHVEVKGSSGTAETVELTAGEVRAATSYQPADLVVVDGITWRRNPDGSVGTDGGNERIFHDWAPSDDLLTPTRYRYKVPATW